MVSVSSAQIPNPGYENWTAGSPINWTTDNAPPLIAPITQSTDAHSGTYSMQGTTVSYLTLGYPPEVSSEFSISTHYGSLTGWFKFSSIGRDSLYIHALLSQGGTPIAAAQFFTGASVSSCIQFNAPITYYSSGVPDDAYIEILIFSAGTTNHPGSTFKIDDLSFGAATGVQESNSTSPVVFALSQNYPNPFNPSTKISYQTPADGMVRLEVYDIMGRTVSSLVNEEKPAGQFTATFEGSNFTSGIYFYRLKVIARDGKSFPQSNKMILMK